MRGRTRHAISSLLRNSARAFIFLIPVPVIEARDIDPQTSRRLGEFSIAEVHTDVTALKERPHALRAKEDEITGLQVLAIDLRPQPLLFLRRARQFHVI